MATRDEKDALELIVKDLVALSEHFVNQAMAVTDMAIRRRIIARAGQLVNVASNIRRIIE